jgi:hypothetical protein
MFDTAHEAHSTDLGNNGTLERDFVSTELYVRYLPMSAAFL